jgi:transcriptional regulator with XRE-family HTH domain
MKRTPDDNAYAVRFGEDLNAAYKAAKAKSMSDQEFADSVGVVRAQLDKYLRGASMPSFRTVVLAHRNHGIHIPYAGEDVKTVLATRARRRKRKLETLDQLKLPFVITTEKSSNIDLSLKSLGPRKFELHVSLRKFA